jgi:hypothetical protein
MEDIEYCVCYARSVGLRIIHPFVLRLRTDPALCSGILTLFQMNDAANDPVTRGLAFLSLILALWSLIYGCIYIIQFRRMRSKYTVVAWALVSITQLPSAWPFESNHYMVL